MATVLGQTVKPPRAQVVQMCRILVQRRLAAGAAPSKKPANIGFFHRRRGRPRLTTGLPSP
jgi:hypothetical protein